MLRIIPLLCFTVIFSACSTTAKETLLPISFSNADTPLNLFHASHDIGEDCLRTDEHSHYELPYDVSVWARMRDGFAINEDLNKRIQIEVNWYARHPSYFKRVSKRASPYLYHVVESLSQRGMPLEFALLPIVESAFDPFAYSHSKASGMWQIVPGTGKMLGLKQNWWYDGRRDIVASTNAALTYLESLHAQFEGDWLLALAAYNSGAGNVRRAIRKNKKRGLPLDYWNLDLPKETETYVPRLLALKQIMLSPEVYKVALLPTPNTPYFESVDVGSQIDLAQAADMAGIDMDAFYRLNPGFNRWASAPNGPHNILVPIATAPQFKEALATLPAEQRVAWERYTIKNGDALSKIAKKHNTTTALLQSINGLNGHGIRAGKVLLIPRASKENQHYVLSASQRLATKQNRGKGSRIEYVVKPGDSLWSIGKSLGVSSQSLAKWNGIAHKAPIRPGNKLVAWNKPKGSKSTREQTRRKLAYKVRKGDSLARIADKFDIRVTDIVHWNNVNTKKYLQPGDKLTLYVDVRNIN